MIAASLCVAGTLAFPVELGKNFGSFRSPDSLFMELFGLRWAWGALINTTGRLKGQLLSDILRSHAVLAVAAAQEAPGRR